jgi:SPP1 gp7 family putative phage head morphogenesis protein
MSVPTPDPLELADQLRRDLDAIDAVAMRRALLVFGRARLRILEQVDALIAALGDPTAAVTSNALSLASRAELLTQIEQTLTRAGIAIEPTLMKARRDAVAAALKAAEDMATAQGFTLKDRIDLARSWSRLDETAVQELITTLADGTPLNRWLQRFGPETSQTIEQVIERAVADNVNVGDLGRELAKETGMAERRALMVTRESTFGVQRRAADQSYRENSHRLSGKMRVEVMDAKTCRACVALHGTIYPVDANVPFHANCRGRMIPVLKSGIGIQEIESGAAWLERQPESVQRATLGNPGYEAWKAGEVDLQDFAESYDTEWGAQTRIVGADRARANARRRTG